MRATVMYGAGDVRVETVPDAHLIEPTDALVTVTRAAICGSDLWPYKSMEHDETGRRMGHEFVGIVEAVGPDVRTLDAGDMVVTPFVWSDGTCAFCQEGLHTSCLHGGRYGWDGVDGGQGEAVRVPQADGTLVVLPVDEDDAMMPSLLTLSDVMATGHHAAVSAEVGPGKTVAVVGDGAVGLCGVIAARRVGVPQEDSIPEGQTTFFDNVTVSGGPAPARAYIEELLPDVLEGRIEPGRVFDRITNLDGVPDGYRAMNEREAIKVLIEC